MLVVLSVRQPGAQVRQVERNGCRHRPGSWVGWFSQGQRERGRLLLFSCERPVPVLEGAGHLIDAVTHQALKPADRVEPGCADVSPSLAGWQLSWGKPWWRRNICLVHLPDRVAESGCMDRCGWVEEWRLSVRLVGCRNGCPLQLPDQPLEGHHPIAVGPAGREAGDGQVILAL
jgi:hypothetical protein